MSTIINNSSFIAYVIIDGKKAQKVYPKKKLEVVPENGRVVLRLYSNCKSTFSLYDSVFWLALTYQFENGLPEELYIQYQEAKPLLKVNHKYKRLSLSDGEKTISATNVIIPEKSNLHEHVLGVVVNIPLTILFYGLGILLFSTIIGFCFKSVAAGIGTAVALILGISIYAVLEDILFEKIFNRIKAKNNFFKKADMPMYYETCANSAYIEKCFQQHFEPES